MARSARPRAAGAVALGVVGLVVSVGVGPEPGRWVQAGAWLVVVGVVAWALWLRRRDRLAYEEALAAESARRAVAEDRLAIARELHEVVSGGLGAVTVRAAVAQRLETGPEGLRAALADVEGASRDATAGLRRMMAVLRGEDAGPTAQVAASGRGPLPVGDPGWSGALAPAEPQGACRGDRAAHGEPADLCASLEPVLARARTTGLTVEADLAAAGDPARGSAAVLPREVRRAVVAVARSGAGS